MNEILSYSLCMATIVTALYEGNVIGIAQARRLIENKPEVDPKFFCLECSEQLHAHGDGTQPDGMIQGMHFQHLPRTDGSPICSLRLSRKK